MYVCMYVCIIIYIYIYIFLSAGFVLYFSVSVFFRPARLDVFVDFVAITWYISSLDNFILDNKDHLCLMCGPFREKTAIYIHSHLHTQPSSYTAIFIHSHLHTQPSSYTAIFIHSHLHTQPSSGIDRSVSYAMLRFAISTHPDEKYITVY